MNLPPRDCVLEEFVDVMTHPRRLVPIEGTFRDAVLLLAIEAYHDCVPGEVVVKLFHCPKNRKRRLARAVNRRLAKWERANNVWAERLTGNEDWFVDCLDRFGTYNYASVVER